MGKLKFSETPLKGLYVIEPTVFDDSRGYFYESYNKNEFSEAGFNMNFVQDNESRSVKGTLRGLHLQINHPQGKLVRVSSGEVFDVAVDLRQNSSTFGKWYGLLLSEQNKKLFYVPEGFAHAFLVLSDYAVFNYKCTDFYYPEDQASVLWNDPEIKIDWPLNGADILLSDRDKNAPLLSEYFSRR